MSGLQEVTALTVCSAFTVGILLTLLGSLKFTLARRLGLNESQVGGLLSTLNLALIPMMLLSGILLDDWGARVIVIIGSLITSAGLFFLSRADTHLKTLGAILVFGAGAACLSTSSILLMLNAFYPDKAAASLNMGNVFFGLGAFVAPAIMAALLDKLHYQRSLEALAILCLVPAGMAIATSGASFPPSGHHLSLSVLFADPVIWLTGLAFLLYIPLEETVGTWGTTYLTDLGARENRASWILAGFWLAVLGSRWLAAIFQVRETFPREMLEGWLVIVLALAAAVTIGNMSGTHRPFRAGVGILILGFVIGPIFPNLVGLLFEHFKESRGSAYGAMFSVGALGGLLFPPLIGAYASRRTVRRALRLPMVLGLLLFVVLLLLILWRE